MNILLNTKNPTMMSAFIHAAFEACGYTVDRSRDYPDAVIEKFRAELEENWGIGA